MCWSSSPTNRPCFRSQFFTLTTDLAAVSYNAQYADEDGVGAGADGEELQGSQYIVEYVGSMLELLNSGHDSRWR